MANSEFDVAAFHNDVFEHLIQKGIMFKPRVQTDDRLKKGHWFIGDGTYMILSFWDGYDTHRKVHNIGFGIDFKKNWEVRLILTSRDNEEDALILNALADKLGIKSVALNEWWKSYGQNVRDSKTFIKLLDKFLLEDRPIIETYISQCATIHNISRGKFAKNVERINNIRQQLALSTIETSELISNTSKTKGRKGTDNKKAKKQLRRQIEKTILAQSYHNELQQSLFEQLKLDPANSHITMEENFIDITQIKNSITYLYEVKPYYSVKKCIRDGIGQLIDYCSTYYSDTEKVVLIIAGPSSPNTDDQLYIEFIQRNLKLSFRYLQIG